MDKQYYLYDENFRYVSTNFYKEQPKNSTDVVIDVDNPEENAIFDVKLNKWISK